MLALTQKCAGCQPIVVAGAPHMSPMPYVAATPGAALVSAPGAPPQRTPAPATPSRGVHQVTTIAAGEGRRARCPRVGAVGSVKEMGALLASREGAVSPPPKAWMAAVA